MPPDIEAYSEAAAALNAGIGSLTTAKDAVEIAPVRVAFESAIDILGVVRVRVLRPVAFLILISG